MERHPGLVILEGQDAPRMEQRTTLHRGGRVLAELVLKDAATAPLLDGMALSSVQASFLISEGGGSCAAALELAESARGAVFSRSGITLEMEVQPWA